MSDFAKLVADACAREAAQNEAIVRRLLERWVSELEPAVAWREGRIIGLCDAKAELDSYPFILEIERA